jgi:hypothetical protein
MKGGYVCLGFQSIKIIMNNTNQLTKKLNFLFKYKPKRIVKLFKHSKMAYFHLECQNPIKNQIMSFFYIHISYTSFQTLECKFLIKKINFIVFIKAFILWKNPILSSIQQYLVIYHTKKLCHHMKHTLLYLWLKYGTIWTNIVSFIESFLIKLLNGT